MKITRKRESTTIRERCVTIRLGNRSGEKFCRECAAPTQFLTADEAAMMSRTTARQIYRLIELAQLHFEENEIGLLLICGASLSKVFQDNE